jgi:predicted nuclease of predicted toxin-antitoxin system
MRFIVDAQLPPALARALTAAGFATAHVADIGLLTASDRAIRDRAAKERAAIITKDGDFACLHRSGPAQAAVVWLRIGNTAREPLVQWLLPLMPEIVTALEAGESLVEIRR